MTVANNRKISPGRDCEGRFHGQSGRSVSAVRKRSQPAAAWTPFIVAICAAMLPSCGKSPGLISVERPDAAVDAAADCASGGCAVDAPPEGLVVAES